MFPKRIVYVLLRFHQAFHLPQGFETFLLLYSRANFTQLIQSCLRRVVNLHDRTYTVGTQILRLTRETALVVPQANSRPGECPQDIKSGDYSGIARRSESKQNIPTMRPGFDSIHTPLFRLSVCLFLHFLKLWHLGSLLPSPNHYHSGDSVLGTATRYGLDGPRFDPRVHASCCRMGTGFILRGKSTGTWCQPPT